MTTSAPATPGRCPGRHELDKDFLGLADEILDGPYSPVAYLAYADWLEERGLEDWAEAWRWVVAKQLEPYRAGPFWTWDCESWPHDDDGLSLALRGRVLHGHSPGQAVSALVGLFQKLDKDRRAQLWAWTPTSSTTV